MKPKHFWGLLFIERKGKKDREDHQRTKLTRDEIDELTALMG